MCHHCTIKYTQSFVCFSIVGDDDGGELFNPDEYEAYKKKMIPQVCHDAGYSINMMSYSFFMLGTIINFLFTNKIFYTK